MGKRGAVLAGIILLAASTSSSLQDLRAPLITAPGAVLAAEVDRPEPFHRTRLPITGEQAPPPRVVLGATTTSQVVALTFDLDMNAGMAQAARAGAVWINQDARAYLESHNIHATLFMTGMWAEVHPALARELATNPNFEIGDHSYSHPAFHTPCYRLEGVNRAEQARQIQLAQEAIQRVTGVLPRYFRFPGGCYDRQAVDLVHAAGLIPVQWNVNSIDAFNNYPEQIAATVLSTVRPGSIVVMHLQGRANAPATGAALRLIIPELEKRGYEFVTVGELLAAGDAIQPTDSREVSEFYQPPARWCGWVYGPHGRDWVCR
jgi:peptidoglycan/xylan/chitin deacetylase (PgdA/CDA1 family)